MASAADSTPGPDGSGAYVFHNAEKALKNTSYRAHVAATGTMMAVSWPRALHPRPE